MTVSPSLSLQAQTGCLCLTKAVAVSLNILGPVTKTISIAEIHLHAHRAGSALCVFLSSVAQIRKVTASSLSLLPMCTGNTKVENTTASSYKSAPI